MGNGKDGGTPSSDETQAELLEGGLVQPLEELPVLKQHRALTARYLAYSLVAILGGTILLHYIAMLILVWGGKTDALGTFEKIFARSTKPSALAMAWLWTSRRGWWRFQPNGSCRRQSKLLITR